MANKPIPKLEERPRRYVRVNNEMKERYIQLVAETGLLAKSAIALGSTRESMDYHRSKDPVFAEAVQEALEVFRDGLEQEIVRRAVQGTDEDVYYQGSVVGQKKNYSDYLLLALMKRHRPDQWKENAGGGQTVNAGVLVVNNSTKQDQGSWEEKYGQKTVEVVDESGRATR